MDRRTVRQIYSMHLVLYRGGIEQLRRVYCVEIPSGLQFILTTLFVQIIQPFNSMLIILMIQILYIGDTGTYIVDERGT